MSRSVPAEFYLELEPTFGRRFNTSTKQYDDVVSKVKLVRHTVNKPDNVGRYNVVIKLKVYVPEHLFMEGIPEAIVKVSDSPEEIVTVTAQWQEEE